jgi:hypothetical protein
VVVVAVGAGADEADLVHRLRHLRQQLAHLQPRHVGVDRLVLPADVFGGLGLGVERVVLRLAAAEEDEDHRLGAGLRGDARAGRAGVVAERLLHGQEVGQRQADGGERTDPKEVTPGDAVAQAAASAA